MAGLRQEIRNQLTAFEDAMGRAPAYVDGHQHVHQLPQVRDVLIEELSRRDQGQNVWLRATRAAPHEAHADLATCAKSWVIAHLGAQGLAQLAHAHGMRQNRRLLGVYGFDGDAQAYRARLVRWLDSADEADLLMCHVAALPSNGWLLTPQDDPIGRARTEEYSVWSAADLGDLLEQSGCSFAPMSSILRDRRVGG
ncbi:hypothetical protein SDC9_192717 [bioreactor metagenome]|uniref:Uncharacterized protein n=1 Tax=bioreactor metagenome TaxID=1076179 RepID=A0A645I1W5_9ZZZZ